MAAIDRASERAMANDSARRSRDYSQRFGAQSYGYVDKDDED
jgi:hypothetical protein